MSAKSLPPNYEKMLGPDFLKLLERLEDVEVESRAIRDFLEIKSLEWDTNLSEIRREMKSLTGEIVFMKDKIRAIKEEFMDTIDKFKMTGTAEDLDRMQKKISMWQTEKFISRREFERMLKEKFMR